MIELDSIMVVFMAEAVLVLFLLIFALLLLSRKHAIGAQEASGKVIDKLQDAEKIKAKKLSELVSVHCAIEPELLNDLQVEIKNSERHLYQQIIRIFLNRDKQVLKEIDQQIDSLIEPYCKLLTHSSGGREDTDKVSQQEQKNDQLAMENERLKEQLTIAMDTMDEISAEYTRVFSGTQTELELDNSSKEMFAIFQQAGQKIKAAESGAGAEQL